MHPITAFILAGGKSTRMGSDKAFLPFVGRPLLSYALGLARTITADVRIVGDPVKFSALGIVVADVYPGRGPLAGIHAALVSSPTDWNLILAVDLPFLQAGFLQYLLTEAYSADAVITAPFAGGHLQPLCAVYRKSFSSVAERALADRRNKVDALFSEVQVRIVGEDELVSAGFNPSIFRNVNTPEDWEAAKQQVSRKRS